MALSGSQYEEAERSLLNLFEFDGGVIFGNARSAIRALLEVNKRSDNVPFVFPSNICSSVVASGLGAGAQIHTVDVSSETGIPKSESYLETIKNINRTKII